MAEKDLNYNITANDSSFQKGAGRTSAAMSKMEREARRLEQQQRRTHAAMEMVGRGMLVAGAAIAAGLALSVRAAIDWESAWAGVLKTVDGTPEQMAALEKEIRGLTAVLPASHKEIAAVAEAAGQLGVQRENVAAFTRVMIDMGEATNLSADEAATSIARMMNIMQTAPANVDRLASAIVDLGNKGATTESEITAMALRIAGAGNAIGLTEHEVLGFAAALSNVGIEAEAGGSAISRVFIQIDKSVRAGGESLDVFAQTAGMSAEQFRRTFQQDAAGAIDAFVQGLGRIQASGGDVNAVLEQVGFTEIRVSDAMRRLAGSGDNLTQSLETGAQAWEENTALTEEAERRYATTASQMAIARNQLNDFAISMGDSLLPVLGQAASGLSDFLQFMSGLPSPLKAVLVSMAALSAGVLVLGGGLLMLIPRIHATKQALDQMGISARLSGTRLGTAASMAGRAAGAIGILASVSLGLEATVRRLEPDISALATGLSKWATTGKAGGEVAKLLGDDMEKLDRALVSAADEGFTRVTATIAEGLIPTTKNLDDSLARGVERIDSIDAAMAGLVQSGHTDQAAEIFLQLARRANENGISMEKLRQILPEYAAALEVAGGATADAADAAEQMDPAARQMAGALELTAGEAGQLTDEIKDLESALDSILGFMFGVEEAQDAAARALREVTDAAKENGTALDGNSDAALDNRDNVRGLIAADFDLVQALAEAGASSDELADETDKLREKFVKQMRQAGFSEEAIEEYAKAYDQIPSAVSTNIRTPGMTAAERNARNLKYHIDRIPRNVRVNVDIHQAGTLPSIGRGKNQAVQHGGEIGGPFEGTDRRVVMATKGEFMIRRGVAQAPGNLAALRAFNTTGRWPAGGGRTVGGGSAAMSHSGGPLEIVIRGDGTRRAAFIVEEIRESLRTNPSFRADVRAA